MYEYVTSKTKKYYGVLRNKNCYFWDVKYSALNFNATINFDDVAASKVGVFSQDQMSSNSQLDIERGTKTSHAGLFAGEALFAAGFIEHVVEYLQKYRVALLSSRNRFSRRGGCLLSLSSFSTLSVKKKKKNKKRPIMV